MGWWQRQCEEAVQILDRLALRPDADGDGATGADGMEMQRVVGSRTEVARGSGGPKWQERVAGAAASATRIRPNREQCTILGLLAVQALVALAAHQFRATRMLIYPFAIVATVFHEFGHAAMCLLTGGHMGSIQINMDESGATRFSGGWVCLILPAGYIGSTLVGALLLFTGFSYRASRYMAIAIAAILAATFYYSGSLFTYLCSSALLLLTIAAYFFKDGAFTRHFVLFLGCAHP